MATYDLSGISKAAKREGSQAAAGARKAGGSSRPRVFKVKAKKAEVATPVGPAKAAIHLKASTPSNQMTTKPTVPLGLIGGAAGTAAAGLIFTRKIMGRKPSETPTAKATKVPTPKPTPTAPAVTPPPAKIKDSAKRPARVRAKPPAVNVAAAIVKDAATPAPPPVVAPAVISPKGTTQAQEGSAVAAGVRKVRVGGKRVQVSSKVKIPQPKRTDTPVAPSVAPKPVEPARVTGRGMARALISSVVKGTKPEDAMAAQAIKPAVISTAMVGKRGAHMHFAKSTFRQPDVNAPARAMESPSVGGIDRNVASKVGPAILRKKKAATPKPAGAGTPLPVKAKPAPTAASLPAAQIAQETKALRSQAVVPESRPGKANVKAQEVAKRQAELKQMLGEAPTERELKVVSVKRGAPASAAALEHQIKKKKSQEAGSAPATVSKARAVALTDRKAQIEAHMRNQGFTRIVGEGDEARMVQVKPAPSKTPMSSIPKVSAQLKKAKAKIEAKAAAPKVKEPKAPPAEVKAPQIEKPTIKVPTDVRPETRYDPAAPLSNGRFWWRKATRAGGKLSKAVIPAFAALAAAEQAQAAPTGQKLSAGKRSIKESMLAGTALAALAKGAPATARIAGRVLLPLGAAVGAYDIARLGEQATEAFKATRHKIRTERHAKEKYGTVELATRTRKERLRKKR